MYLYIDKTFMHLTLMMIAKMES